MHWLILGDYRSGKTLRLVIEAFSEEYKDREIWGNFELRHPNYRKISILDLMEDIENKLILLDEMQNWFNSHNTFSIDNEFFTDLLHDCDKANVDLFGTSHRFMSNEIDFREGCHRIIKCERITPRGNYLDFSKVRRVDDIRDFKFTTFSMYDERVIGKEKMSYDIARAYFPLYNTSERVKRLDDKDRELKLLMRHKPKLGIARLRDIARELKPLYADGKKLTHASLIIDLGDMDYSSAFEREIYTILIELL